MEKIVNLYTTNNLEQEDIKQFRYSLKFTGDDMLKVVSYNLKQPINSDLSLRYVSKNGESKTMDRSKMMEEQDVKDAFIIFLLPEDFAEDLTQSIAYKKVKSLIDEQKEQGQKNCAKISVNIDANYLDFSNELEEQNNFQEEMLIRLKCLDKFDENELDNCDFYQNMTFQQVLEKAKSHLGITSKEEFVIFIEYPHHTFKYMGSTNRLDFYEVTKKCIIHLFPKIMQITVQSYYFKTTVFDIDITQNVEKIVQNIGKIKNIKTTHDFTLSFEDEKGEHILRRGVELPAQTKRIDKFSLYRKYFNFSREDVVDEINAINAINDTIRSLSKMTLYPTEDQIIDLIYYAFIAFNNGATIDMMPPCFIDMLKGIKMPPDIYEKVMKKYEKATPPDQLNCARLFLRTIRIVPGFGSDVYRIILEEDENHTIRKQEGTIIISPIFITVASDEIKKSRSLTDSFFYRISYACINDITADENIVSIEYIQRNKVKRITIKFFKHRHQEDFIVYFNENSTIIRGIIEERARRRALGEKIKFTASFDRVELFTTIKFDEKSPSKFIYDKSMNGKMLVETALANMKIKDNPDKYEALLVRGNDSYDWVEKDKVIASMTILDGMMLIITPAFVITKIYLSGSVTKTLKINIKLKVSEIINLILSKIDHPESESFWLYSVEDKEVLKPLDRNQYIPSQTFNCREFYFKRRIFILSQEDTLTRTVRIQVVNDCSEYLLENKTSLTIEQALELAILKKYVHARSPTEIANENGDTLNKEIPSWFKCDKKVKDMYLERLANYDNIDQTNATKRFLKIVRNIPEFGSETFNVLYSKGDLPRIKKDLKDIQLVVNGFGIAIKDDKSKVSIPWLEISKIRNFIEYIYIVYQDKKGQGVHLYILPRDLKNQTEIKNIYLLLMQYISCLSTLNKRKKNRIRKEPIEAAEHIHGTFKDSFGKVHEPEIDLFIGIDPNVTTGLEKAWFPFTYKSKDIITKCICLLGLESRVDYVVLLFMNRKCFYMNNKSSLSDYNPSRNTIIFIIKKSCRMTIKMLDNPDKDIKFDISIFGSDLFKQVVEMFNIADKRNYALLINTTLYKIPLLSFKRICEQTSNDTSLLLVRHSFNVPKTLENADIFVESMFNEIRHNVTNEEFVKFNDDVVKQLVILNLMIEKNEALISTDVKDDLSEYTAKTTIFRKNDIRSIRDMCKNYKFTDKKDLMLQYINIASHMPMYAFAHIFVFINDVTAIFFVDTTTIYIISKDTKEVLLKVPLNMFLKINSAHLESKKKILVNMEIVYFNEDFQIKSFTFTSYVNDVIKDEIDRKKHDRHKMFLDLYKPNIEDYSDDAEYKETIETNIWLSDGLPNSFTQQYDIRYSYEQVIGEIRKLFQIPLTTHLSIFLPLNEDKFIYLQDDLCLSDVLLLPEPQFFVFETFFSIKVSGYENGGTKFCTKEIIVDLRMIVEDIIPEIAKIFDIQYWTGYTLYVRKTGGDDLMLDVKQRIPEQTIDLTDFVFMRKKFCLRPFNDLKNSNFAIQLFDDVFREYLTGKVEVSLENVVAFALYAIIVHSKDEEDYNEFTPDSFDPFLPNGYDSNRNYLQSLIDLKEKTQFFGRKIAAQKFLTDIFRIKEFSAVIFDNVTYIQYNINEHRDIKQAVSLSVNFSGVRVFYIDPIINKGVTVLINFDEILDIETIGCYMVIAIVSNQSRKYEPIRLKSSKVEIIKKEIILFLEYLSPLSMEREKGQKAFRNMINNVLESNKLLINVSKSYFSKCTDRIILDCRFTGKVAKDYICKYFAVTNQEEYELFANVTNDISEEVYLIKDDDVLSDIGLVKDSTIFLIKIYSDYYITCPFIGMQKARIKTTIPTTDVIVDIMKNLGIGFSDGFGLKYIEPSGKELFMRHNGLFFTHNIKSNDLILERRVFVFSVRIFEDIDTMKTITADTIKFLKTLNHINDQKTAEIAALICIINGENNEKEDFSYKDEVYFSKFFPTNSYLTKSLIEKFKEEYEIIFKKNYNRNQLMAKVIFEACRFDKYGAKIFKGEITTDKIKEHECEIVMNPYLINVYELNGTSILSIPMEIIETYLVENNAISMQYSIDGEVHLVSITSPELNTMYDFMSYANYLANRNLYLPTIKKLRESLKEVIDPTMPLDDEEVFDSDNNEEESVGLYDSIQFNDDFKAELISFDDMNTINFDFDNSYVDSFHSYISQGIDFDEEISEEEILWRLSIRSLMFIRLFNTLGAMEVYLSSIADQIESMDQQSLLMILTQLSMILLKKNYVYDGLFEGYINDIIVGFDSIIQDLSTATEYDTSSANKFISDTQAQMNVLSELVNNEIHKIQSSELFFVGQTGLDKEPIKVIKLMLDLIEANEFLVSIYKQKSVFYIGFGKDIFQITDSIEKANLDLLNLMIKLLYDMKLAYFVSQSHIELSKIKEALTNAQTFNSELEILEFDLDMENNTLKQGNEYIKRINEFLEDIVVLEEEDNTTYKELNNICNAIAVLIEVTSGINFEFSESEEPIFVACNSMLEYCYGSLKWTIQHNIIENIYQSLYEVEIGMKILALFTNVISKYDELEKDTEKICIQRAEIYTHLYKLTNIHITYNSLSNLYRLFEELSDKLDQMNKGRKTEEFKNFQEIIYKSKDFFLSVLDSFEKDELTNKFNDKIRDEALFLAHHFYGAVNYFKHNEDPSDFEKILEYLNSINVSLNTICTDSIIYFDMHSLPHVKSFHNLHNIIHELYFLTTSESGLESYLPDIKSIYNMLVEYRDLLHQNPYSTVILNALYTRIREAKKKLQITKNQTSILQISSFFKKAVAKSVDLCSNIIEEISAVKTKEFIINPTLSQVKYAKELSRVFINRLKDELANEEISNTIVNQIALNDAITYFEHYQSFFISQEKNPSKELYKFFKDVDISISNFKLKIISTKFINEQKEFFDDIKKEMNRITMLTLSSFEYTETLMKKANTKIDILLNVLDKKKETESEDSQEYIESFINELEKIRKILGTKLESNNGSSIMCITIRKILSNTIRALEEAKDNPLFSSYNDETIEFNILIELFESIILAIDNLPFVLRVFPPIEKIEKIIDFNLSLRKISAQLCTVSVIAQSFDKFPDLIYCKSLIPVVNDLKSKFVGFANEDIKEDVFFSYVIKIFKDKDDIIKKCSILEPVLNIKNFKQSIINLFCNMEAVVKHVDSSTVTDFTIIIIKEFLKQECPILLQQIDIYLQEDNIKTTIRSDLTRIKELTDSFDKEEKIEVYQNYCNELQKLTANSINSVFQTKHNKELIDSLYLLYTICTKYATSELESVSFTNTLIIDGFPKLAKISSEVILSVSLDDTLKEIDVSRLKNIYESIAQQFSKFASEDILLINENIDSRDSYFTSAALRAATVTSSKNYLIENCNIIATRSILITYQTLFSFGYVLEEISESLIKGGESKDKRLVTEIGKIQSIIKGSDFSILQHFHTIDIIESIYQKFNIIYRSLPSIYFYIAKEPRLQNLANKLFSLMAKFAIEFANAANDLFLLFFEHLSELIVTIEEYKIDEREVLDFIRQCATILINTNRLISIDYKSVIELSDLFNHYVTKLHSTIDKLLENNPNAIANVDTVFENTKSIFRFTEIWRESRFMESPKKVLAIMQIEMLYQSAVTKKFIADKEYLKANFIFKLSSYKLTLGFITSAIDDLVPRVCKFDESINAINEEVNALYEKKAENSLESLQRIEKEIGKLLELSKDGTDNSNIVISGIPYHRDINIQDESYVKFKEAVETMFIEGKDDELKREDVENDLISQEDRFIIHMKTKEDAQLEDADQLNEFYQNLSSFNMQNVIFNNNILLISIFDYITYNYPEVYLMVEKPKARKKFIKQFSHGQLTDIIQDICLQLQAVSSITQIIELLGVFSTNQIAILIIVLRYILKNNSDNQMESIFSSLNQEKVDKQTAIYHQIRERKSTYDYGNFENITNSLERSMMLIYSIDAQNTLLQYLSIIKQRLLINKRQIIATTEKKKLFSKRFPINTIIKNQNLVKGQLSLISSPKILDAIQKTFSYETIILQIRILDSLIKELLKIDKLVISSPTKFVDIFDVFTKLVTIQISKIRCQGDLLEIEDVFDIYLIERVQKRVGFDYNVVQTALRIISFSFNLLLVDEIENQEVGDLSIEFLGYVDSSIANGIIPSDINPHEAIEQLKLSTKMLENLLNVETLTSLRSDKSFEQTNPIIIMIPEKPITEMINKGIRKKKSFDKTILSSFDTQNAMFDLNKHKLKVSVKTNAIISRISLLKPHCKPEKSDNGGDTDSMFIDLMNNTSDIKSIDKLINEHEDDTVSGVLFLLKLGTKTEFSKIYKQLQMFEEFTLDFLARDSISFKEKIEDADGLTLNIRLEKLLNNVALRIRRIQSEREKMIGKNDYSTSVEPNAQIQKDIFLQILNNKADNTTCDYYAGQCVLEQAAIICEYPSIFGNTAENLIANIESLMANIPPEEILKIEVLTKNNINKEIALHKEKIQLAEFRKYLAAIYTDAMTFIDDKSDVFLSLYDIFVAYFRVKKLAALGDYPKIIHEIHSKMNIKDLKKEIVFIEKIISHPLKVNKQTSEVNTLSTACQTIISNISGRPLTSKYAKELMNSVLTSILDVIERASNLSIEESFELAIRKIDVIINAIKTLIELNLPIALFDFKVFSEELPKFVLVLPKILPVIQKEQNIEIPDTISIVKCVIDLGMALSDKSDKEQNVMSRKTICELYSQLLLIKSSINIHNGLITKKKVENNLLKCISSIAISASEFSYEKIVTGSAELQGIIFQNDSQETRQQLSEVIASVEEMKKLSTVIYVNNENITSKQANELFAKRDALINYISNKQLNEFDQVQRVTTYDEANQEINQCLNKINMFACNMKADKGETVISIIYTVFMTLSYAGKVTALSNSVDFITKEIFASSLIIEYINSFVKEAKSEHIHELKKQCRRFERVLYILNNNIEDESESSSEETSDEFYLMKLEALKSLSTSVCYLCNIAASFISTKVTDVFIKRIGEHINEIDQSYNKIKISLDKLIKENTDDEIGDALSSAESNSMKKYNQFREVISTIKSTKEFVLNISECIYFIRKVSSIIPNATNRAKVVPDYDSANIIHPPLMYPHIALVKDFDFDGNVGNVRLCSENIDIIINSVPQNATNDQHLALINTLVATVEIFNQSALILSTMTSSPDLQCEITSTISNEITTCNIIRLLLYNTFIKCTPFEPESNINLLKEQVKTIVEAVEKAVVIENKEREIANEFEKSIVDCIKNIQEAMRKNEVKISDSKETIEKDVFEIMNALSDFLVKHINMLREKNMCTKEHVSFMNEITKIILDIHMSFESGGNRLEIIKFSLKFIVERINYYMTLCDDNSKKSLESLANISKAFITKLSFNEMLPKKQISSRLLERLELEAKVIKARTLLQRTTEELEKL